MKTQNFEFSLAILNEFALSTEEMNYVRGGEGDPLTIPTYPPVKI